MRSVGRLSTSMDYHKEPNSFLPPIKSNKDISEHTKYIPKDLKGNSFIEMQFLYNL